MKLVIALGVWFAAVAAALVGLDVYKSQPGERAEAPKQWPAATKLPRTEGRATALVFIHPRCPCSRATLTELRQVMSAHQNRADVFAVFMMPAGDEAEWKKADTWSDSGSIDGVTRIVDPSGEEAKRFGSATSGQVLFYGADGSLRMSGGITPARGHVGDNPGRQELVALLEGETPAAPLPETPVFGCAMHDEVAR